MTNEVVPAPTIYERLGGEAAVRAAVDLFYSKVLADPELAPFFATVPMDRLRSHQFKFLSQALGGPIQYSGESMANAHAHLAIEQRHFEAVAGYLVATLKELAVGAHLVSQVIAQIAPLASQIVNSPSPQA